MSVPVDGHVHFHALGRVADTLEAAARNFAAVGPAGPGCMGVLLLTQAHGERVFERLAECGGIGDWRLERCGSEPCSLLAVRGEHYLVVVCGRQVRCELGLEVVALGTLRCFTDGAQFAATLREVQESGALAVLPWGFGKWSGRRGELVRDALAAHSPGTLAVGDNGGRLAMAGQPSLLQFAAAQGFQVLPGTDPFPFGGDYRRTGAFGFLAGVRPGTDTPWADLAQWLRSFAGSPPAFGRALGPARFLFNNVGIQLRNRLAVRVS